MEIIEKSIEIKKTGRYYMLGKPSNEIKHVLIGLHGYGQLGKYFIKNFEELDLTSTLVIVPEGLSRFYLRGTNGRVGASWMTKEDRLNEINDQINYLDQMLKVVMDQLNNNVSVKLLGFSQGTATLCRWLININVPVSKIILWAGSIPEETIENLINIKANISYVLGTEDEYIDMETAEQKIIYYKNMGLDITLISFEGKHHLDKITLKNLIQ